MEKKKKKDWKLRDFDYKFFIDLCHGDPELIQTFIEIWKVN